MRVVDEEGERVNSIVSGENCAFSEGLVKGSSDTRVAEGGRSEAIVG